MLIDCVVAIVAKLQLKCVQKANTERVLSQQHRTQVLSQQPLKVSRDNQLCQRLCYREFNLIKKQQMSKIKYTI